MNFSTLAGVALRSLFLEASWNEQGQQNLGLASAIDPALKQIHRTKADLTAARKRALGLFNTNPVLSGLAIGILLKLEEEVAAGKLSAAARTRLSAGLNRALAATGDIMFWQAWLPFCCLAAVLTAAFNQRWAPWLLPLMFGLPALAARWGGLYLGYRLGGEAAESFFKIRPQLWAQRGKRAWALLAGAGSCLFIVIASGTAVPPPAGWSGLGLILVAAAVAALRPAARQAGTFIIWYPLISAVAAAILKFAWDAAIAF